MQSGVHQIRCAPQRSHGANRKPPRGIRRTSAQRPGAAGKPVGSKSIRGGELVKWIIAAWYDTDRRTTQRHVVPGKFIDHDKAMQEASKLATLGIWERT